VQLLELRGASKAVWIFGITARKGSDDGDHTSGRRIATLQDNGSVRGHIYFQLSDDSELRAERE